MREGSPIPKTLLDRLRAQDRGGDVVQYAVDTLTTLPEMQQLIKELTDSLNPSGDPKAEASAHQRVERQIVAATVDRPHGVFNRWVVFLRTGTLPLGVDELRRQAGIKTQR